jgi:hypothetical protein
MPPETILLVLKKLSLFHKPGWLHDGHVGQNLSDTEWVTHASFGVNSIEAIRPHVRPEKLCVPFKLGEPEPEEYPSEEHHLRTLASKSFVRREHFHSQYATKYFDLKAVFNGRKRTLYEWADEEAYHLRRQLKIHAQFLAHEFLAYVYGVRSPTLLCAPLSCMHVL